MESTTTSRRRSGLKGKLVMSFYKAPKPSSVQYMSSKVKPTTASTATVGFVVADEFPVSLPPTPPQMKEKIHTVLRADNRRDIPAGWYADIGDENVDKMAANYISRMQERFRLE